MRRDFGMSAHEVDHGFALTITPAWEIEMLQRQRLADLARQKESIDALDQAGA